MNNDLDLFFSDVMEEDNVNWLFDVMEICDEIDDTSEEEKATSHKDISNVRHKIIPLQHIELFDKNDQEDEYILNVKDTPPNSPIIPATEKIEPTKCKKCFIC